MRAPRTYPPIKAYLMLIMPLYPSTPPFSITNCTIIFPPSCQKEKQISSSSLFIPTLDYDSSSVLFSGNYIFLFCHQFALAFAGLSVNKHMHWFCLLFCLVTLPILVCHKMRSNYANIEGIIDLSIKWAICIEYTFTRQNVNVG